MGFTGKVRIQQGGLPYLLFFSRLGRRAEIGDSRQHVSIFRASPVLLFEGFFSQKKFNDYIYDHN